MKLYDIPNNLKVMAFLLAAKNQTQYFIAASEIEIYLSLPESRDWSERVSLGFCEPGINFPSRISVYVKIMPGIHYRFFSPTTSSLNKQHQFKELLNDSALIQRTFLRSAFS